MGTDTTQQESLKPIHQNGNFQPVSDFSLVEEVSLTGPNGESSHLSVRPTCPKIVLQSAHSTTFVVLATIIVPLLGTTGRKHDSRALLDTGSSASFITEKMVRTLGLKRSACHVRINAVGEDKSQAVNGCLAVSLGDGLVVTALIMDRVVGTLPSVPIPTLSLPGEVTRLSDVSWNVPGDVDMLLGADIYHEIVTGTTVVVDGTCFVETRFGWAISGPIPNPISRNHVTTAVATTCDELERFWEI